MKIYAMADIHGFYAEFEEALALVLDKLQDEDTMLLLLGDYIHGGYDNRRVLDKIMELQREYGSDKVMALMGNHEEFVLDGVATIDYMCGWQDEKPEVDEEDEKYIDWMYDLPRYYADGNTIFVHAGIDEEAGDWWDVGTDDYTFTSKYPAETGKIHDLDMKVVAGHVGTAEISGDPSFHEIFYDGASHYYIDGTVIDSGVIPVIMVDTDEDEYYRVTESGCWPILPYGEDS